MADWSLARRIAFRFVAIVTFLLVLPFPLRLLPGSDWLERGVQRAWEAAVAWFAEGVLGIDAPPHVFTGSGDTLWHYVQLALIGSIAVIGTLVWSIADRRRRRYDRMQHVLLVVVRYFLACMMLLYGIAKVVPMQFPPLWLGRYDATLGEMSPMGLLWTFMQFSQPYVIVTGIAEILAGLLLLWRRGNLFGALLSIAVMANVVLLNFNYDVCVKLFSLQLLAMGIALVLPHARRLIGALLGNPTSGVHARARGSVRYEITRSLAKFALLASIAFQAWGQIQFGRSLHREPTVLHGAWRVDRHVRDGVDVPPLFTDDTRWRKLIVHERGATLRFATDRRTHFLMQLDEHARTITLETRGGLVRHTLAYTRASSDRLVLDGAFAGRTIHVELVLEPPPPITTRGFHWVQEHPHNR
ncbi:MAG: MauE/DoxX family redox-associated membrane protein [Kofleriaceae bacterium]